MEFIVDAVRERAANACPPLFLGIGIGGSFDLAARLAKHALLNITASSHILENPPREPTAASSIPARLKRRKGRGLKRTS
jgi:tartrate dehydratase alpha subunit/fumarate hydratase class I-like protein